MEVIKFKTIAQELPVKVIFSAAYLYEQLEHFAGQDNHPYQTSSQRILEKVNEYPELRDGIEDLEELKKHEKCLQLLFESLFPLPLQSNEIKAIMMPFQYFGFLPTKRFSDILKAAGGDFELNLLDYNSDKIYIYACSYILAMYYGQAMKASRPIYIDIPNKKEERMYHYRALFNVDFINIEKTNLAPELTSADVDELLFAGEDIELWKSKFPPGSYILKGFGLMNLFDITQDELIAKNRSLFLRQDERVFADFQENLQNLFNIEDLQVGYSVYNIRTGHTSGTFFSHGALSLFLDENEDLDYEKLFCESIVSRAFKQSKIYSLSDVETYATRTEYNLFAQKLLKKDIKSLILIPIQLDEEQLQLIELGAKHKNQLNALNAIILEEVVPFIKIASERFLKESLNELESTIQENYTSIHPAVKWRFVKAALAFNAQKRMGMENPVLDEIVFEQVYPLYGQSDIKGSSVARNEAIQADLEVQLSLVIETLEKVMRRQPFPIYKKLIYRVETYLSKVKMGLKAGDEITILQFLKKEIYPVFNHVKTLNKNLKRDVETYLEQVDETLHVVYQVRKAYDDSVNMLNEKLAGHLDKKQAEAQQMFPHYFQRYKTDGVEYNIYMGASLVDDRSFDMLYLQNLCLWQLETMWELEQIAYELSFEMSHPLQVASLILIHHAPLSIKFQMDGKQFDVDGAYNARYEIIKKRIDKAYIKGTTERLTQVGKIAMVYSQDEEAEEYLNYIEYLQVEGKFGRLEMLEIEDLQGVSGMKAMRVEVLYEKNRSKKSNLNGATTPQLAIRNS